MALHLFISRRSRSMQKIIHKGSKGSKGKGKGSKGKGKGKK